MSGSASPAAHKAKHRHAVFFICILCVARAEAATWYVATSGSDAAAGTNWASAKQTIQAAIDLAAASDTVLVSNGVYATGGRVGSGLVLTNRVYISDGVTVQSVNGPAVTTIVGAYDPVTTNGDAAVRCAYVGNNSSLIGFTLTNGATRTSGDVFYERTAGGANCEASGILSNCVLVANRCWYAGGGAYRGTLNNCTLSGNAVPGGGGGGEWNSVLNRCILSNNAATFGGGAYYGTLNNCLLTGNSSDYQGGGSYYADMINCTLVGNSATNRGGGGFGATAVNCIIVSNAAPLDPNYIGTISYSCATPLQSGTGNIASDPQFVNAATGNYRLAVGSPCIDSANNAGASGAADLDGGSRTNGVAVDMGAYEAVALPPLLTVAVVGAATPTGGGFYPAGSNVLISATGYNARWLFSQWNDGNTNMPRTIVMPATNITYTATFTQNVGSATSYVAITGTNPVAPYDTWATAATNIQDAVDIMFSNDVVIVSNGVYATGGRVIYGAMTNRVAVSRPTTVRSLNGPAVTIIQGAGPIGDAAVRCVYLGTNASLIGFTLVNGATRTNGDSSLEQAGGGLFCETNGAAASNCVITGNSAKSGGGGAARGTLNNCVISGNSVSGNAFGGGVNNVTANHCTLSGNSAYNGGGSAFGTLNYCTLTNNTALNTGGGASGGTLNNCLLTGNYSAFVAGGMISASMNNCTVANNSANNGVGGVYFGTLFNCIVDFNSGTPYPNYYQSSFTNSCTTPLPTDSFSVANTAADPQFANAGAGNYRLLITSPCIDTGNNGATNSSFDLDGHARIVNGIMDMGAYEYDQSLAAYDSDADGFTDQEEYYADTQPTNGASYFPTAIVTNAPPGALSFVITPTSTGRVYFIDWTTNLLATPQIWTLYGSAERTGNAAAISFTVTNDAPGRSYRTGVRLP